MKMSNGIPILCLLLVFSIPFCSVAFADGFRNPPAGAAGLGRAGVNIAHAEDGSAVFFNPANMLFMSKPSVYAGLTMARLETEYKSMRGNATSEADWQALPNLYAIYPLEDRVMAGIGVNSPYGQSVEWDRDSVFKYMAPYFVEMKLVNVNPSLAYRLVDNVLVGIGADIYDSSLEIRQDYFWSNLVPGAPDGNAVLEGDGEGLGGNAGITWIITPNQRLAFTYHTSVRVDYRGDARISNMPAPLAGKFKSKSDFQTDLQFPEQFAVAYGIQVGEKLRIEADVERLNWSKMGDQTLDLGVPNTMLLGDAATLDYSWEDTWTYGIGGDCLVDENWIVRAGYNYIESPIPNRTFNPSLPDGDRHVIGLGLGFRGGPHAMDFAWDISLVDDRDIANNQNLVFNGKYEMDADMFAVSYSYTF